MNSLLVLFVLITSTNTQKLLSTVVIHRHGDRTPYTTYKNDPYKDAAIWPEGPGQLTKQGIQRQYNLGKFLRSRYSTFLPPHYSPSNVKAVSTDADRTLMSASLTLAALFPPLEEDKFDRNLNWQPIPIHTTPRYLDPLLTMSKYCKKWQEGVDQLLRRWEINYQLNGDLYRFLTDKTGDNVTSVYDVDNVYNTLHTQFLANKTLPSWASEVYPDRIKRAVMFRFKLPCYSKELAHLRTGLLFGEIVRNFDSFVRDGRSVSSLLLFSGHDSTLADVLMTLGAFDDEIPSYSSCVLLELYSRNETHFVNLLFTNETGVYRFVVEGCDFDCNYESFKEIVRAVVVDDQSQWEKECDNDN